MSQNAYFELIAGAAGDMLLAAAIDAYCALNPEKRTERAAQPGPTGKVETPFDCPSWASQLDGLLALEPNARISLRKLVRGGLASAKVDFYVGETHADHYNRSAGSQVHSHSEGHRDSHDGHSHDGHSHGGHSHDGHSHDHKAAHHHGRHLHQIEKILVEQAAAGNLSDAATQLACRIFSILADAEARVHGSTREKVHFHEVGAFDAIMDIAGFATIWTMLDCRNVSASPVTLGSGSIQTQHGAFGVPAPAVVEIVREFGIPISDLQLKGECLTPTGAACLAAVVQEWGKSPPFSRIVAQGIGAGTRESAQTPNVVRLLLGH